MRHRRRSGGGARVARSHEPVSCRASPRRDAALGRQSIVGGASIYPFVQNLLLAARALGLAANLTVWHFFAENEFKQVLGVPKQVTVYALVPVGWPAGRFGPVRRRPVADVVHWDRWSR